MNLKEELGLRTGFSIVEHEALLNIYYTASLLRKKAADFFKDYDITDVQFNVLELLHHQGRPEGGLTQVELSHMLLVNRSNITAIIDRMEHSGFVTREDVPGDRRCHVIRITPLGQETLRRIEPRYIGEVRAVMAPLSPADLKSVIRVMGRIREGIRKE